MQILSLLERSFYDEDVIPDTPIEIEELEAAVKHLRRGSSSGPDGILPEHIIYAGIGLMIWLKNIYNAIISLEQMPDCFKSAFIIPIFKGKGKDPLSPSNYRVISLSSVVGKLFERVILARILPFLQEIRIPHYTQSSYQAGISRSDPTEVIQEAIKGHISNGGTVYHAFYDLEKALDSVEFHILLSHVYNAGIKSKTWRRVRPGD